MIRKHCTLLEIPSYSFSKFYKFSILNVAKLAHVIGFGNSIHK